MPGWNEPADQVYVDLYWIPLGAGGWFVKRNGRLYESLVALPEGRPPRDLYHSALEVVVPEGRFVIEQAPVPRSGCGARGVVAEGSCRPAGRGSPAPLPLRGALLAGRPHPRRGGGSGEP